MAGHIQTILNAGKGPVLRTERRELQQLQDEDGGNMLFYSEDEEMIGILVEKGLDVNWKDQNQWTPLLKASREGKLSTATALLKHRAEINAQDEDGNTALMQASIYNHVDVIKLLLEEMADVTVQNTMGKTALDYTRFRNAELAASLEEAFKGPALTKSAVMK
mmetsp:Transcript_27986/g.60628  ORF Transcript_27986/g.60628 Transcript_27986/m.60628 type:complete len:163 (+) Transcript_27986:1-489(+)